MAPALPAPGLAFKAVVVGGRYASGREIAEFFLPAGGWGGIAMAPAMAFFVAMTAFAPGISVATLPSDVVLAHLGPPVFRALFQVMVFAALLESGSGAVHAINERVAAAWSLRSGASFGRSGRAALTGLVLLGCLTVANRVGLVALIASGYRLLAYVILALFVAPLLTIGMVRLRAA